MLMMLLILYCEVPTMSGILTGDRMVRLEVAGVCRPNLTRKSNYSVTVPYNSMSRTMQSVMRMGGRVTGVHVSDIPAAAASVSVSAQAPEAAKPTAKGQKK
jgi:hypothetical protein